MPPLSTVDATTIPVSLLAAFQRGDVRRDGSRTRQGEIAPVENEIRGHWRSLRECRRTLADLLDPSKADYPLRDEWIDRTRSNADWHRRRLIELFTHRRRVKASWMPVFKSQAAE